MELAESGERDAVDVLREFYDTAKAEFGAGPRDGSRCWRPGGGAGCVGGDVSQLVGTVDWVTKRWLFTQFVEGGGDRMGFGVAEVPGSGVSSYGSEAVPGAAVDFARLAVDPEGSGRGCGAESLPPTRELPPARNSCPFPVGRGLSGFVDWEVVDTEG